MDQQQIASGQRVAKGQRIGVLAPAYNSNNSRNTGLDHLHFGIRSGYSNPFWGGNSGFGYATTNVTLAQAEARGFQDPLNYLCSNPLATYNLQLTSQVVISPNPLVQNSPVTVTASLRNNGTSAFSGYIAVALHNTGGAFLGDIQRYDNETIAAGQTRNYTFRKDAIASSSSSYRMQVKFSPDNVRWNIPSGGDIPVNVVSTPTPIAKVNQTITFSPSASAIVGSGPYISVSSTLGLT